MTPAGTGMAGRRSPSSSLIPAVWSLKTCEEEAAKLALLRPQRCAATPGLAGDQGTPRRRGDHLDPRWPPPPEPVNLRRLKAAVKDRWGVVPLLGHAHRDSAAHRLPERLHPAWQPGEHRPGRAVSSGCCC